MNIHGIKTHTFTLNTLRPNTSMMVKQLFLIRIYQHKKDPDINIRNQQYLIFSKLQMLSFPTLGLTQLWFDIDLR